MKADDVISRQAAINAAIEAVADYTGYYSSVREEYIRKALERLRPVTPQYTDTEIQKMQDLEFAEIQKAYEIGKAENPNKWIPVSERLPEKTDFYLIQHTRKYCSDEMAVAFYSVQEAHVDPNYTWEFETIADVQEVIAWMPLPEPYKASPTGAEVLDRIRAELHATAEMHEDGNYYLREEWIDEIFDKYRAESEVQDADSD